MAFLSRFKTEFDKLFHSAPTWIHTGKAVIAFAAPIVTAVIAQFASPAVAAEAAPIVAEIQSDLTTASLVIGDGTATPSLADALTRVQTNLGALLTAGHVKDAKVQADVNLVTGELAAVVAELPTSKPSPTV